MIKTSDTTIQHAVQIKAPVLPADERVLTSEALKFLHSLHQEFDQRRLDLLEARKRKQAVIDLGKLPNFLPETTYIRESDWQVAPIPAALQDRRVEITGPVDRKMIINALNSGAKVFMADLEDSTSPTWRNIIEGQFNLMDAVRGTISYQAGDKKYELNENPAVLNVRPRGWHLSEKHLAIDEKSLSASLVDFGLFIFHNGEILASQERGPFFYLPKLECHQEAALWNDVFYFSETYLGIKQGTIRATVLIETILAAFEMDEIIYELRDYLAGLNAGRWDYIFSIIKKFKMNRAFITPERARITMAVPFMSSYAQLLVKTCHKRGAHAIGGMSAFIPSKDETVNRIAYEKVKEDKQREVKHGYDGTWVAHPKLVEVAQAEFDRVLGTSPHQKIVLRNDVKVTAHNLLDVNSAGQTITEKGVRTNINIALLYIESWLKGNGAAALHNLMEDAATAEISRAQLWQWLNHEQVFLDDGRKFRIELYLNFKDDEMQALLNQFIAEGREVETLSKAEDILDDLVLSNNFSDFLTIQAYKHIN
jgi:malate synthase